jgi:cytochrome P450
MVAELRRVVVGGGGVLVADALGELRYMGAVLKEALRLWPPGEGGGCVVRRGVVWCGKKEGQKEKEKRGDVSAHRVGAACKAATTNTHLSQPHTHTHTHTHTNNHAKRQHQPRQRRQASTARWAPHGTTLAGYDVGGTVVYPPNWVLQRDPELWGPDAEEFKPERWLLKPSNKDGGGAKDGAAAAATPKPAADVHPWAYLPFSRGPRDCIGQAFALMEAKALLCEVRKSSVVR